MSLYTKSARRSGLDISKVFDKVSCRRFVTNPPVMASLEESTQLSFFFSQDFLNEQYFKDHEIKTGFLLDPILFLSIFFYHRSACEYSQSLRKYLCWWYNRLWKLLQYLEPCKWPLRWTWFNMAITGFFLSSSAIKVWFFSSPDERWHSQWSKTTRIQIHSRHQALLIYTVCQNQNKEKIYLFRC